MSGEEESSEGHVLSVRELQVLREMSRGLTNRQIGSRLGISPETVKTHVERIFKRLSVNDRTEAVVKGMRTGLIE